MVLLVMLVHALMRLSLLWHSVMDASVPSQSTAAKATGRFSNKTCTASINDVDHTDEYHTEVSEY